MHNQAIWNDQKESNVIKMKFKNQIKSFIKNVKEHRSHKVQAWSYQHKQSVLYQKQTHCSSVTHFPWLKDKVVIVWTTI